MEGEGRRVWGAVDSGHALLWAVDNVDKASDHLILIAVHPEGNFEEGRVQFWELTGSPVMKRYEANKPNAVTLDIINAATKQKEVDLLLKIWWWDAHEKLCAAIDKILLSCIVLGNSGLGKIKRAIMGSVSNYVVNNGSCPVTVVESTEHVS